MSVCPGPELDLSNSKQIRNRIGGGRVVSFSGQSLEKGNPVALDDLAGVFQISIAQYANYAVASFMETGNCHRETDRAGIEDFSNWKVSGMTSSGWSQKFVLVICEKSGTRNMIRVDI